MRELSHSAKKESAGRDMARMIRGKCAGLEKSHHGVHTEAEGLLAWFANAAELQVFGYVCDEAMSIPVVEGVAKSSGQVPGALWDGIVQVLVDDEFSFAAVRNHDAAPRTKEDVEKLEGKAHAEPKRLFVFPNAVAAAFFGRQLGLFFFAVGPSDDDVVLSGPIEETARWALFVVAALECHCLEEAFIKPTAVVASVAAWDWGKNVGAPER